MTHWIHRTALIVLLAASSAWGYTNPIENQTTETVTNSWDLGTADLYVGSNTWGNAMVVTNGGAVENGTGLVGSHSNASNNTVLVTGASSAWHNREALYLGGHKSGTNWVGGGTGNALAVEDVGWVLVGDVDTNNLPYIRDVGDITAGDSSGFPEMIVASGSVVESGHGTIGLGGNESGSVTISDVGSVWENTETLCVGYNGSSNVLSISSGGMAGNRFGFVGLYAGANNNIVLVEGDGSVWSNSISLDVGYEGNGNQLAVAYGGEVQSAIGYIGFDGGGNSVVVSGAGSEWNNSSGLYVGFFGTNNRLSIESGGKVQNVASVIGRMGANNTTTVSGTGSVWENSGELTVGYLGHGNALIISNGGRVESVAGNIGRFEGASNNTVVVSGDGSVWQNHDGLFLGGHKSYTNWVDGGTGNLLTVESNAWVLVGDVDTNYLPYLYGGVGGIVIGNGSGTAEMVAGNGSVVTGASYYIGWAPYESGSLTIVGTGQDSEVNIALSNSTHAILAVGWEGSGNSMVISNGGGMAFSDCSIGLVGSSSNNSMLVTGNDSVFDIENQIYVGYEGSRNSLRIENGARVEGGRTYLSYSFSSSNNSIVVSGTDSQLINSGYLYVGCRRGVSNSLHILNSALVSDERCYIGASLGACNSVTVDGTGSVWSNAEYLMVGVDGSDNSLRITGGGRVESEICYIGRYYMATNNVVWVHGTGSVLRVDDELAIEGFVIPDEWDLPFLGNGMTVGDGGLIDVGGEVKNWSYSFIDVNPDGQITTRHYNQDASSILKFVCTSNASTVGILTTSGSAILDGKLSVVLNNGFVPALGYSVQLFDWGGSVTGGFSVKDLPMLPTALGWDISKLYTDGTLTVIANPDLDGDGMPDAWEQKYFVGGDGDPDGNADGDAHRNLEEYITGMNPTNAQSCFSVTNCAMEDGNGFVVEWLSVSNRLYRVKYAESLTNSLQTLESNIEFPRNSYTDTVHHTEGRGFYKVDVRLK